MSEADKWVEALHRGDRRALSRAITLIESSRPEDESAAADLLTRILPYTGKSLRIGITGIPGVGKSTFIEALGKHILSQTKSKLAVLAIDPTSRHSRGSILADKTRMHYLSTHSRAYIRPSPSSLAQGGMARSTQESILLCEAAGYDYILIETVGVGQTELAVREVVDCCLLLVLAGAGDEWQGVKRGIVEIADFIIINKEDRNVQAAQEAQIQFKSTMRLIQTIMLGWRVPVLCCSAVEDKGIQEIWQGIQHFQQEAQHHTYLTKHRAAQRCKQFEYYFNNFLLEKLKQHPSFTKSYEKTTQTLLKNQQLPRQAAQKLLDKYFSHIVTKE